MAKVLFEITEEQLETGLRGYPCGYCTTSYVEPQKGLLYVGHPVSELAFKDPEEIISLLYFGKETNEKKVFLQELNKRGQLSLETIRAIEALPKCGHPMKVFSAALLLLGMIEGKQNYREDCLNVIAKIPHLAAVVINSHAGWGKTAEVDPSLGYIENFVHLLNVPGKKQEELEKVMRLFSVLHFDHGGGNLSAFVGKAVASGLEDMYGSLSSAMCALAGSRHGKANQDALLLIEEVLEQLGPQAKEEEIETFIRKKISDGGVISGFGHAVLRTEDPRATVQYIYGQKMYAENPLVATSLKLRKVGSKILQENSKIACPYPNVDAISGALLSAAGFGYPKYFTVLFGLARVVGISIQIVYERLEAKEGKGTPIVRPKYLYKERA